MPLRLAPNPPSPGNTKKKFSREAQPKRLAQYCIELHHGIVEKTVTYFKFPQETGPDSFVPKTPKQSDSAIRRNMDPVAHVTQPQNREVNKFNKFPLCSIVPYAVHYFYT